MRVLLALALVLPFAASGFAQSSEDENSLAGLAERSKKKSEQAKVITGDDLRRAGGKRRDAPESVPANPSSSGTEADVPAEGDGETEPKKTEDEVRADLKAELQSDLAFYRDNLATLRKAKQDAQDELADISSSTPSVTSTRRSKLMLLIEGIDSQIPEQEQLIAEVEERARRAGIRL